MERFPWQMVLYLRWVLNLLSRCFYLCPPFHILSCSLIQLIPDVGRYYCLESTGLCREFSNATSFQAQNFFWGKDPLLMVTNSLKVKMNEPHWEKDFENIQFMWHGPSFSLRSFFFWKGKGRVTLLIYFYAFFIWVLICWIFFCYSCIVICTYSLVHTYLVPLQIVVALASLVY